MLVTFDLPEAIDPPKFKMFERLEHCGQEVAIVGIRYTQPWLDGLGGWQYEVDPMVPLWLDAGCPDYNDGELIPEKELKRPKKARRSKATKGEPTSVKDILPDVVESIQAA